MVMKPAWLEGLIAETFFAACGTHETRRKNEKNIFCLDCCRSICPHCVPCHRSHPLLQVRRYVYHDVVRLDDLEKLIDCSYVQPYTINSAKVVFLNQRPQSRPCKGSANICFTCDRILQEPFHFCSLSCKVDHVVLQGGDLSSILYRFDESDFAFSQFEGLRMDGSDITEDDDQITPNSILEDPLSFKGSSCSSNSRSNSGISQDSSDLVKKKKGNGFLPGIVLSLSRRKGAPHRSPLS
ncbi:zinc finger protein [Macleaya cordata]|uniref:Zinc finger protein n=1 Tax=Macleaya cordata TaxID=56857 RepID=A0A200Q4Z2_MACCD|nr:zinc finger protein [Macleaya cordata]